MPRGRPKGSKNKPKTNTPVVKEEIKLIEKKQSKPRGRKAKTKIIETQTLETAQQDQYFEVEEINPFQVTQDVCECDFEPMAEWSSIVHPKEETKKLGAYSTCRLPIKTTRSVYPVVGYIKTDVDKYRSMGYSDKQIFFGCINYLSKNQSKNKLKRLGDLYPYSFSIKNDRISAMFLTTERKSKMFWGEGG